MEKNLKRNKYYALPSGYVWNPLKSHPRNGKCPCGSEKKFKKCHLNTMTLVLPTPEKAKELAMNTVKQNDEDSSATPQTP